MLVKVRFKVRANMVFNENELAYIDESRVSDVAGVVVVEKENIPKNKKEA